MEISRTKLRKIGWDWAIFDGPDFVFQGVSGIITNDPGAAVGDLVSVGGETAGFGVLDAGHSFFGLLDALRQNNLVKVLAEPTLVTVSGRPASFNSGGEFPIIVPQSLGTLSIEFKEFGTRVDFVPIVLGNGNIRLECRPQVSEIDNARGVTVDGTTVPGLRKRYVDTAAELRAGQTLAVAGLIQTRVESENRGLPFLADLPWAGAAFRFVEEKMNEIELLVLVRPELVDSLDPHEVPVQGPGEFTTSPNDVELYLRGYLEVPKCCSDGSCPSCQQAGSEITETHSNRSPIPVSKLNPAGSFDERQTTSVLDRQLPNASVRSKSSRKHVNNALQNRDNRFNNANSTRSGLIGPVGYDNL